MPAPGIDKADAWLAGSGGTKLDFWEIPAGNADFYGSSAENAR